MKRLLAVVALATVAVTAAGCGARSTQLQLAGKVRADTIVLGAPALPQPTVNVRAALTSITPPAARSAVATTSSQPRVSGRVTEVRVAEGDRVKAGEVLVVMDRRLLDLQTKQTATTARRAKAESAVLRDKLDEVRDKQAEVRRTREKVVSGLAKIAKARAQLASQRAKALSGERTLVATRAKLLKTRAGLIEKRAQLDATEAQLAAQEQQLLAQQAQLLATIARLEEIVGSIPTAPPLPDDPRVALEEARAALAQVNAGLAQVQAALAQVRAGLAKLNAGLAQLNAGLAKVNAGLAKIAAGKKAMAAGEAKLDAAEAKARSALAKIDDGLAKLAEARRALERGVPVSEAFAKVQAAGIPLAEAQAALVVVRAPADGVVLSVADVGDVVMVNAPLVTLRASALPRIDTYVTAAQLRSIRVGTEANVLGDWSSIPQRARVVVVGRQFTFPPTTFPTNQTHMTRAFRVTLELEDANAYLPAGVPVDVTFDSSR